MPEAESVEPRPGDAGKKGCMLGMFFGILLGAFLAFCVLLVAGRSLLAHLWGGHDVAITASSVIRNIQRLERLETVVYTLDQIATGEHSISFLPSSLAGDRILLIVHGDVTAGI